MRRALAIIGVVVMIAVALVVRSRVEDTKQRNADEKAKATLYCVTEVRPVCDELARDDRNLTVVTEDAGRTVATLSSADFSRTVTPIDGWLAPRPYLDLVNDNRARAGLEPLFGPPSRVIARSPVVLVGWNDRLPALARACGGAVTWRCLGENAGRSWTDVGATGAGGAVQPVIPPETRPGAMTATTLLTLAEATASYFGRSDYSSNDFTDPGFTTWLGDLADTSKQVPLVGAPPLTYQLTKSAIAAPVVGGALEAQAVPAIAGSRDKDRLTVLYPSPLVSADVVLAPTTGSDAGGRLQNVLESDRAAHSFAQNGWRVDGQSLAQGVRGDLALPDGGGLPRAGVLNALRDAWQAASQ